MKNSILTLLALAALASCNKKDSVSTSSSVDSTDMSSSVSMDSPQTVNDSATVPNMVTDAKGLSDQDKTFVDAAAKGGMMEVMMGELASANATNASVKSLGQMIAKDHKMANDELKKWAATVNYSLPSSMDASQQKMHEDLKSKKGADFDNAYVDMMVNDHKKDIAAFKKQSADGADTNLKAFATKTFPILENHLKESEKVKAALK